MEETQTFLTDARRKVLNSTYNGNEGTKRSHKSKIRTRARTALSELIEVAQSDEIDNSKIFEPDDLARLLDALMTPNNGLTPRWNYDSDPQQYREEYQYQIHLHSRLNHALDRYGKMIHQNHKPGTEPDASWPEIGDSK